MAVSISECAVHDGVDRRKPHKIKTLLKAWHFGSRYCTRPSHPGPGRVQRLALHRLPCSLQLPSPATGKCPNIANVTVLLATLERCHVVASIGRFERAKRWWRCRCRPHEQGTQRRRGWWLRADARMPVSPRAQDAQSRSATACKFAHATTSTLHGT
ncbi:hypothetical protein BD289DRAFT_444757 [Coniella lustricola]|uniref:Uncharacterized protein n=1 Tax=Coniella lustricola TaxID=2025994 RepID=A0A2T2ZVJ5_9PEZI|nr:hypothetical protein BD289DRAFT_444757 [Coniella lustricola]